MARRRAADRLIPDRLIPDRELTDREVSGIAREYGTMWGKARLDP